MNRYLKIVVAMFLMIFTFVSTLQPLAVQAATQLADGEYSIGFKVLKDASDEVSMMNEYSVSPGTLKVKDGKKKVSFTLKIVHGLRNLKQTKQVNLLRQM